MYFNLRGWNSSTSREIRQVNLSLQESNSSLTLAVKSHYFLGGQIGDEKFQPLIVRQYFVETIDQIKCPWFGLRCYLGTK